MNISLTTMPLREGSDPLEEALRGIVTARQEGHFHFVNLPMVYPGGSFVTVTISSAPKGYRVSDAGYAYRELEQIGAERSFGRAATRVAESLDVERNTRELFVTTGSDGLMRAVCDVSAASWQVVDRVYQKQMDEHDDSEFEDMLRERLGSIFGAENVSPLTVAGASTTEWPVTALVSSGGQRAVFQAVNSASFSLYRANTAFDDLADLDSPPRLIAVVKDKLVFGTKLALLSRAGRVIQEDQDDDVYRRAAA